MASNNSIPLMFRMKINDYTMSSLYFNQLENTNSSLAPSFTFRHILENTDHFLLEVRNDLFLDHRRAPTFQWLKISKDFAHTTGLKLNAVDSAWDLEERFFEEGYLKFGPSQGIFIEKFNKSQHQYKVLAQAESATLFTTAIQTYFAGHHTLIN